MYIPNKYLEEEWEQSEDIINRYPLGTVITHSADGIIANHIPFYVHIDENTGKKYLRAHLAKANHQLPALKSGDKVCVVFQSANSYITPSWYANKKVTHKFVPTWDFAAVHIYGTPTIIDDYQFVRDQITKLTDLAEAYREDKWKVTDAPESYTNIMQKAITGLEIEIETVQCKYKFEQGMKTEDYNGVQCGLAEENKDEVSDFVGCANARYCAKREAKKLAA